MKVLVEALVTRFKGQLVSVYPIKSMYSEVNVCVYKDTEAYEYLKSKVNDKMFGDYDLINAIKQQLNNNERLHVSGEAKDVSFTCGEFSVSIESKEIDWE